MDEISLWVDFTASVQVLTRKINGRFRSSHEAAEAAKEVQLQVLRLGAAYSLISCEGSYLTACAEYELAIREVIEQATGDLRLSKARYVDLPQSVRNRNRNGAAIILSRINKDKYAHLTHDRLVQDLYSCLPTSGTPYVLCADAFTDHDRNLKSDVLTEMFKWLAIRDLWTRLGNEAELQANLGLADPGRVAGLAKQKLDNIIGNRNTIMHRGRTSFTPGPADVKECAVFFKALVRSTESVVNRHVSSV